MSFQIHGLPEGAFQHYFGMTDAELAQIGAERQVVREYPGSPCRVSLEDARVGEEVVLFNYEHQPAPTPYRASHAIFVRKGVTQAQLAVDEVPEVLASRFLSLRGFDHGGILRVADVCDGRTVAPALEEMLAQDGVDYIHVHNAKQGCFAAKVTAVA